LTSNPAPYCFLDVDGVLLPDTAYRAWIGPGETPPSSYHPDYHKQDHWEVRETPVDNTTHYAPDQEAAVKISRLQWDGEVHSTSTILVRWSSELVGEFQELITTGVADVHYLSFWRDQAPELLSPLFGFPETVSYVPWAERGFSDYSQVGKRTSLEEHYIGERRGGIAPKLYRYHGMLEDFQPKPFAWFDDLALSGWSNYPSYESEYAETHGLKHRTGVDCLLIAPTPSLGISREHMRALKEFLKSPETFTPDAPPRYDKCAEDDSDPTF
jgi:hypothetical protein